MRQIIQQDGEIHDWFGLSYASYLTIARTILQSMPLRWQSKFVKLLNEIPETIDVPEEPKYQVISRNAKGRFIKDDLCDYERGRRRLPLKKGEKHD